MLLSSICLLLLLPSSAAFAPPLLHYSTSTSSNPNFRTARPGSVSELRLSSNLLDDFKTAKGELVNPYKVLKVSRDADVSTVKKSYRDLSRKFHPDGYRHRRLLPGSCNNLDDVRDHWERIRISYEILKNPKLRTRYDRHEVMSDPKAAVQRAAVDAAWKGVQGMGQGLFQVGSGVGKGLFSAGTFAFQQMIKEKPHQPSKQQEQEATAAGTSTIGSVNLPNPKDVLPAVVQLVANGTQSVPGLAPLS